MKYYNGKHVYAQERIDNFNVEVYYQHMRNERFKAPSGLFSELDGARQKRNYNPVEIVAGVGLVVAATGIAVTLDLGAETTRQGLKEGRMFLKSKFSQKGKEELEQYKRSIPLEPLE